MSFKKFSTDQDAAKQDRTDEKPAAGSVKTPTEAKPAPKS